MGVGDSALAGAHFRMVIISSNSVSSMVQSNSHDQMMDSEKAIQRNPHLDFKTVEGSRPIWRDDASWTFTKTKNPDWKPGEGSTDGGGCLQKDHIQIDPYAEGRPAPFNYKLLISAVIPRPIAFVSTQSKDGSSTNLAPFSYFSTINHDPPLFTIGFAGGFDRAKDSLRNLKETEECCINIISEHYIEAANVCSVNAPYGMSEWVLSGLHPAPCSEVRPSRVQEAVFSMECKLVELKEFESRATPGKKTSVLAIVEGVKFWAREDAINEERNMLDPDILRPMARLGGISYSRLLEGIEIPRPDWDETMKADDAKNLAQPKADGQ